MHRYLLCLKYYSRSLPYHKVSIISVLYPSALSPTITSAVTTRTTSLASVPLSSFALRFSDLVEIESATHEDEEQRALRTMDWIASRVSSRCAKWIEMVEAHIASGKADGPWKDRTPWWEEVKRCVEGDCTPSRIEGWNHPVAGEPCAYIEYN